MRRSLIVLTAFAMLAGQTAANFAALPDGANESAQSATSNHGANSSECPCCPDDVATDECLATCLAPTSAVPATSMALKASGRAILSPRWTTLLMTPAETPPTPPPIR